MTRLVALWSALIALVQSVRGRGGVKVFTSNSWTLSADGRFYVTHDGRYLPVIAGGVDTTVAAGAAEVAELWSTQIWVAHLERAWWGPYIGDSEDSIIVRKMELTKAKGDTINYYQAQQLTGDGILDDARLWDNEEQAQWYSDDVTLRQFRNAIRLKGKLSEQRTQFEQAPLAKRLLRDWLTGFVDNRIFVTLATSFTRAIYGGDATSTATIESGDYQTLAMLLQAKTLARKATPQIVAPMVKEGSYFVLAISPDSAYDLQTRDPAYDEGHREAMQRGPTNPLFTDAEVIRHGVVIRSSTRVPLTTDWGAASNLNGSEGMFFGVRAGVLAIGSKPEIVIQTDDYADATGYAIRTIMEVAKSTFNSADNSVIGSRVFRSNIS